jgi:hypothetical protein
MGRGYQDGSAPSNKLDASPLIGPLIGLATPAAAPQPPALVLGLLGAVGGFALWRRRGRRLFVDMGKPQSDEIDLVNGDPAPAVHGIGSANEKKPSAMSQHTGSLPVGA